MESAGRNAEAGGKDFDSDVAIATGELGQLIPQLIEALGGIQAPAAAAVVAEASTDASAPAFVHKLHSLTLSCS